MNSKRIAQVLLCRCSQNKKLFGITLEKRTGTEWELMYSYPLDEERIKSEGFDKNEITAELYLSPSFIGCPFCRTVSFFQCGVCNRLNCDKEGNLSAKKMCMV